MNHNVHANLPRHKFKTRAFPSSQLVQLPACFSLPSLSIIYSVGCLLREAARCSLIPHSGSVCVVARTWNRPILLCILVYHGGMTLNKLMSPAAGRVSVRVELFHAWVQHLARLCDRRGKQLAAQTRNVDFRMWCDATLRWQSANLSAACNECECGNSWLRV